MHGKLSVKNLKSKISNLSPPHNSLRPQKHLHIFCALGIATLLSALITGLHKTTKQRMGLQRLCLKFRMKLAAQEIRRTGDFDDLPIRTAGRRACDAQAAA